jgi:hypothetical protein
LVKDGVSRISEGRRKTCIDADEDSSHEDYDDEMLVIKTSAWISTYCSKRRSFRYGIECRYSSTVRVGQHIHYIIASDAGRNASDTPKCGYLISFPNGKNGRTKNTHIGRLLKFDLEKGTPYKKALNVKISEVS